MTDLTAGPLRHPADGRTRVAIVGAGLAGLGLGIRLRRAGASDFLLLERADEVGGVWRDNVYPGVACDIPSHLYSYSFRPKDDWSRVFAPGPEILDYLRKAAAEEGVLAHVRLGTALESATWDDAARCWRLVTSRGPLTADVLVLAAGRLTQPRLPDVPGLAGFSGRAFHSARWEPEPLTGLRVGVVGTGASAVQLLPHVAQESRHTVVFQRTPAWVLPRGDRAYAAGEPRPSRTELAAEAERLFEARLAGSDAARVLRARSLGHLADQVDDPALREALTPTYDIGCKRAVFSDDYFPALQRPDVTLEASALARVEGSRATAASGAAYDLDVLVFATGFETARQPYAELVVGRRGETLAEHWRDGMTSHASTVVSGFPNLFIVDGPNATLGHHSAIEIIEAQLDYILGALDHLARDARPLEVSAAAEAAYTDLVDRLAARTVWLRGGCESWYLDPRSGRIVLLWPERASEFRRLNATFEPAAFGRAADER
ncbi:flavin-containing monooxygenase [Nocardioides sp. DS6]|uniref:Flavin-containing monooxygenase n=1 Tax=Nocardioides eburneus TaxID=3231482 RepID=A0ABV3SZ46_9ACTN